MATTDRVLVAAEEEFGEHGYDRARLSDIASRAGISRPSLLYHFGSKQELYTAVVRTAFARLGETLGGALSSEGTFEERVRNVVNLFSAFLDADPKLARLILREHIDGRGPGRDLLMEAGVPVLDQVEIFAREQEDSALPGGLTHRAALMALVAAMLVRSTTAEVLIDPLWGDHDNPGAAIAAALLPSSN